MSTLHDSYLTHLAHRYDVVDAGTYEAIFTTSDDAETYIDVTYTIDACDETDARTLLWDIFHDDHPTFTDDIELTLIKDGAIL